MTTPIVLELVRNATPVRPSDALPARTANLPAAGVSPRFARDDHAHDGPMLDAVVLVPVADIQAPPQAADGWPLELGASVFLSAQSDETENGVYVVNDSGQLARSERYATQADLDGAVFLVRHGDTKAGASMAVSCPGTVGAVPVTAIFGSGGGGDFDGTLASPSDRILLQTTADATERLRACLVGVNGIGDDATAAFAVNASPDVVDALAAFIQQQQARGMGLLVAVGRSNAQDGAAAIVLGLEAGGELGRTDPTIVMKLVQGRQTLIVGNDGLDLVLAGSEEEDRRANLLAPPRIREDGVATVSDDRDLATKLYVDAAAASAVEGPVAGHIHSTGNGPPEVLTTIDLSGIVAEPPRLQTFSYLVTFAEDVQGAPGEVSVYAVTLVVRTGLGQLAISSEQATLLTGTGMGAVTHAVDQQAGRVQVLIAGPPAWVVAGQCRVQRLDLV